MSESTTCVIAGGGPAGMVLGLLLARAGVEVTVLEKHADFLRDFRGDTVHPSTLELLEELGLYERFAELPQSRLDKAVFPVGPDRAVTIADFRRLRRSLTHPYIAMVPQWDFLNLVAEAGREEASFTLRMSTEVTGLVRESGRVAGVRYRGPGGEGEIRADLTVACDGRGSLARREMGLVPREFPVGIDAWWFRLPREPQDRTELTPRAGLGRFALVIPREGYLQLAYIGRKGTDARLRARGIEAFRRDIAELMPELDDRVGSLESMDEVKHLDVRLNRLRRWHAEGLLCIGDAAHAMSPVGGVGINLAVQDAVASATLLAKPLSERSLTGRDLAAVRRRRILPTAAVQALQRLMHRGLADPMVRGERMGPPRPVLAALDLAPWLSFVPAYLIGKGIRPEHAPGFARRPRGAVR
ncbi:2-polyprenyl-6-methoxyphenol hydroxylase-like FAD-dependent oxidoreductase [Nocardiopsis arvandica]|uniref:2-polyprenyl-6-methoxyphenol hydroxylase-like FAD-dependent oxidoreductase n=1 Tax=Nocardiopsis sinuspersici TaxID=501010 RepID=A0A7Y9XF53_9ACTN|nr:FAD-dependent oxidoreductase [Nocardiopsis sinuspersici]NYH54533.1 2-polyprenyl-6-methoxyphenol hydroxylase-like FAD-dependent oxidoreductase [Nocardiopsis sinuspersici]